MKRERESWKEGCCLLQHENWGIKYCRFGLTVCIAWNVRNLSLRFSVCIYIFKVSKLIRRGNQITQLLLFSSLFFMERKRNRNFKLNPRPSHRSHFLYCFSLLFFSVCALFSITSTATARAYQQDIRSGQAADGISFKEFGGERRKNEGRILGSIPAGDHTQGVGLPLSLARRFLSGPGSSPPRCTSKCGKCTPCKPVHVPVPPGTPVTAEYYPEAWRCKCGNKLYMPWCFQFGLVKK